MGARPSHETADRPPGLGVLARSRTVSPWLARSPGLLFRPGPAAWSPSHAGMATRAAGCSCCRWLRRRGAWLSFRASHDALEAMASQPDSDSSLTDPQAGGDDSSIESEQRQSAHRRPCGAPLQRAHRGHGMDVVDIDALAAFTMLLSDIQASTPRSTAHPALLLPARFFFVFFFTLWPARSRWLCCR